MRELPRVGKATAIAFGLLAPLAFAGCFDSDSPEPSDQPATYISCSEGMDTPKAELPSGSATRLHVEDGDEFIGEDPNDPRYVWDLGELDNDGKSDKIAGGGPTLGVMNDYTDESSGVKRGQIGCYLMHDGNPPLRKLVKQPGWMIEMLGEYFDVEEIFGDKDMVIQVAEKDVAE